MNQEEKVLYFGYGLKISAEAMKEIIGRKPVGRRAFLKGYDLCIQGLDQIPDTVLPNAPESVSPRFILEKGWGKDFRAYTITSSPCLLNSEVIGMLWELTPKELEIIRDWELIDFGWFEEMTVTVMTMDGCRVEVVTEGLRDGQRVERVVDGKSYQTFLNPEDDFKKNAKEVRKRFGV